MNAKHILLNHFSQRYQKNLTFIDGETHLNVGCAYDLMCIEMNSFWKLKYYVPIVNQLFADDVPTNISIDDIKAKKARIK
jgi:ribonuclease BN (tRNA processing enzyme)